LKRVPTVEFSMLLVHHIISLGKTRYPDGMDNVSSESLGLRVRIERVKRRLKQSELATLVGVSQADVSHLELDKKLVPARRKRILAALGIEETADGQ
jgi:hypothetical protein